MKNTVNKFYEFFAGGGMVRAGLGPENWKCLFANDFDLKKGRIYRSNWGWDELKTADVRTVTIADLPDRADLVWASFPCQDLSLAGGGAGLKGDRSGTFWPFWKLMRGLIEDDRAPKVIVLENVCGTLSSHEGADFVSICEAYLNAGYRFGAVVIDAALFVPQSRPRLFVIGVREDLSLPSNLVGVGPNAHWHPRTLGCAYARLSPKAQKAWIWWRPPFPPVNDVRFIDLVEEQSNKLNWHTEAETERLLKMMSPINLAKIAKAKERGERIVGTVYKRTREDAVGSKVQRAEIRFDDIAGCLRTPAGGSSRQVVVEVEGGRVRSRLISSRETARLMGLPEDYVLPEAYNEAYHLTGDGVVVPVVRFLAENLLEPVMELARVSTVSGA